MEPPIKYIKDFVDEPNRVLEILQKELDWEHRDAPRYEVYMNDFDKPYTYGRDKGQRTYLPKPYHAEVLKIREKLEKELNCKFEVCFLNQYKDQTHHLGFHADNSPEMDDDRPIVTVSLGAEREIWFAPTEDKKNITKVKLGNGSACIMLPQMQNNWIHKIPKAGFICGPRVSLTFRGYVNLEKVV